MPSSFAIRMFDITSGSTQIYITSSVWSADKYFKNTKHMSNSGVSAEVQEPTWICGVCISYKLYLWSIYFQWRDTEIQVKGKCTKEDTTVITLKRSS